MTTCPICEKHKNNNSMRIFENDHFIINSGPLASQVLGYLYIEPKKHVESWDELPQEALETLGTMVAKAERGIKELTDADRVYNVTISEAVRHLHMHLIPRLEGQEVRGVSLITQATQQSPVNEDQVTQEHFNTFLVSMRSYMNQ